MAIIYAVALWRLHWPSSWLLLASLVLFVLGFLAVLLLPAISTFLSAASIVVYGVAYIALGRATVIK